VLPVQGPLTPLTRSERSGEAPLLACASHICKVQLRVKGLSICAINPKHEKHFTISVYTSLDMTEEEFNNMVRVKLVGAETALNSDMRLRWHVKDQLS